MKNSIISFNVGFLFALGLGISGMTNPQNILNFLDVFGNFSPNMILVMMAAIFIHTIVYHLIKNKKSPIFDTKFHLPTKKDIDKKLILGSVIFGIGWGISGYCPGPAFTSLSSFDIRVVYYLLSLLLGMIVFKFFEKKFL